MRWLYNLLYRYTTPPWVTGPREELVRLVEQKHLLPGRALDLGCGVGDNALFLAKHGFDVTGVDFSPPAIARAKQKVKAENAAVLFLVDDLTHLTHVSGKFDVLVDYGTFDDLALEQRAAYLDTVLSLCKPTTVFLLWCFEWKLRWWERLIARLFDHAAALEPGEIQDLFGGYFNIERLPPNQPTDTPAKSATYLMSARRQTT